MEDDAGGWFCRRMVMAVVCFPFVRVLHALFSGKGKPLLYSLGLTTPKDKRVCGGRGGGRCNPPFAWRNTSARSRGSSVAVKQMDITLLDSPETDSTEIDSPKEGGKKPTRSETVLWGDRVAGTKSRS